MENAYNTFMAGFTTIQSPGAELDKDLRDWIAEAGSLAHGSSLRCGP